MPLSFVGLGTFFSSLVDLGTLSLRLRHALLLVAVHRWSTSGLFSHTMGGPDPPKTTFRALPYLFLPEADQCDGRKVPNLTNKGIFSPHSHQRATKKFRIRPIWSDSELFMRPEVPISTYADTSTMRIPVYADSVTTQIGDYADRLSIKIEAYLSRRTTQIRFYLYIAYSQIGEICELCRAPIRGDSRGRAPT